MGSALGEWKPAAQACTPRVAAQIYPALHAAFLSPRAPVAAAPLQVSRQDVRGTLAKMTGLRELYLFKDVDQGAEEEGEGGTQWWVQGWSEASVEALWLAKEECPRAKFDLFHHAEGVWSPYF